MKESISIAITVGVPAIISIIGFIVTVFTLKKNFQNELVKQKTNIQLEKMAIMPYEILALLQDMISSGKKKGVSEETNKWQDKMNWIFSTIYAYGSSTAIHILAAMQSENYQNSRTPEKKDMFRMMSFYILLTVQIRADITGEVVSPEEWFKMKLTDFGINREKIKEANNRLIDELGLCRQYIMQ